MAAAALVVVPVAVAAAAKVSVCGSEGYDCSSTGGNGGGEDTGSSGGAGGGGDHGGKAVALTHAMATPWSPVQERLWRAGAALSASW